MKAIAHETSVGRPFRQRLLRRCSGALLEGAAGALPTFALTLGCSFVAKLIVTVMGICRRGAPDTPPPILRRGSVRSQSAPALLGVILAFAVFLAASPVYAEAPRRIVSLKPNITEILFAVGAGDRVVGVTKYCDYPAEVKGLPRVADYVKPFTEEIIALAPDLIIGSKENGSKKSIHMLDRMGFEVHLFSFTNVAETLNSIGEIGALVGNLREARELVDTIKAELNEIRKQYAHEQSPRVLVVWGHRPLVVTGNGAFVDEIIKLVGAVNASARGVLPYPHWNAESVIAANPEVIIDMAMGSESTDGELWSRFETVDAVKNRRIFTLDDSLFRAGPRLAQAARALAKVIHKLPAGLPADPSALVQRGRARKVRGAAPAAVRE